MKNSRLGIIILAAGKSSRMGQAKQLLPVGQTSLIQHIINISQSIDNELITVVLGANHDSIKPTLKETNIKIFYNKEWASGIGSSIRCGVQYSLQQNPDLDALIVLVCDQYFVDKHLLEQLLSAFHDSQNEHFSIISAHYENTLGVPALFSAEVFESLLKLNKQYGARKIIKKYAAEGKVKGIPFPKGIYDIDTPEEYELILKMIAEL